MKSLMNVFVTVVVYCSSIIIIMICETVLNNIVCMSFAYIPIVNMLVSTNTCDHVTEGNASRHIAHVCVVIAEDSNRARQ